MCCQVAGLRRQLVVGRDAAMEEVQLRNRFLSDKLERLEQAFTSRQPAGISQVANIRLSSGKKSRKFAGGECAVFENVRSRLM